MVAIGLLRHQNLTMQGGNEGEMRRGEAEVTETRVSIVMTNEEGDGGDVRQVWSDMSASRSEGTRYALKSSEGLICC